MRDNTGYLMVFIGGFLLGSLLTGGVFGTYLLLGAGGHRAMMQAQMEAEMARQEAMVAREMAEEQAARARAEQQKAEERLREANEAKDKGEK